MAVLSMASCFDPPDATVVSTAMTETSVQADTSSASSTGPTASTTGLDTAPPTSSATSAAMGGSSETAAAGEEDSTSGTATPAAGGSSGEAPVDGPCEAVPAIQSTVIDTFESGEVTVQWPDGRSGSWYAYGWGEAIAEAVAEPPFESFAVSPGGYGDSQYSAALTVTNVMGLPPPEFAGFGIELSLHVSGDHNCSADASDMTGIRFWARGNTTVRVDVIQPSQIPVEFGGECSDAVCYDHPSTRVELSEEWTEYTLEFSRMTRPSGATDQLDPTRLMALGWAVDVPEDTAPDQVLEVQLDDVGFVQ